jgi:lipoprotein-anchoring transpeptidase ErfK/SrfK
MAVAASTALTASLLTPRHARAADALEMRWVKVVVDLSDQKVLVFDEGGTQVREWPASTGAASTPTPQGHFSVRSKSASTFVRDNPRVRMRWMTRFRGAVGFHGIPRRDGVPLWTPLGRKGVSHGCVRLRDAHAKELFAKLPIGAVVVVRA